jgi:hypothetical protein
MIENFLIRFIFLAVIYCGFAISIDERNSYIERILVGSFSIFAVNLMLKTI